MGRSRPSSFGPSTAVPCRASSFISHGAQSPGATQVDSQAGRCDKTKKKKQERNERNFCGRVQNSKDSILQADLDFIKSTLAEHPQWVTSLAGLTRSNCVQRFAEAAEIREVPTPRHPPMRKRPIWVSTQRWCETTEDKVMGCLGIVFFGWCSMLSLS